MFHKRILTLLLLTSFFVSSSSAQPMFLDSLKNSLKSVGLYAFKHPIAATVTTLACALVAYRFFAKPYDVTQQAEKHGWCTVELHGLAKGRDYTYSFEQSTRTLSLVINQLPKTFAHNSYLNAPKIHITFINRSDEAIFREKTLIMTRDLATQSPL